MEKAAEIVAAISDRDKKMEAFCYFEDELNPHAPESDESADWQCLFAEMCGYIVPRCASVINME